MTLFLSGETFVAVALRNSFLVSGEARRKRVCIVFAVYSIAFPKLAFLIWRCARCFHRTFFKINFCNFSGEALSLPSAYVYFAVLSLLVPTACKTYGRKWNSMLVSAAEQFVLQTSEFFKNHHPLNPLGIIWLTQLQSKFRQWTHN